MGICFYINMLIYEMIIVKLTDQLGNQMFAYASAKTMALNKNAEFRYYHTPVKEEEINDTDSKYGHDINSIFSLPQQEEINEIPSTLKIYKEKQLKERYNDNYVEQVKSEVTDNCVMIGHFISAQYFESSLNLVREWFKLPEEIKKKTEKLLKKLSENEKYLIVSVHFRVGKDYTKGGYTMHKRYWIEAAEYITRKYDNIKFVCIYDKKTKSVEEFMKKYNAIDCRKSLVEDMSIIAATDINICCNSTFSIMASMLNNKSIEIVRPMKHPTQAGWFPDSIYPREWTKIGSGKRSLLSAIYYKIQVIKRLLKKILNRPAT